MQKIKWLFLTITGLLLFAACGTEQAAPATSAPATTAPTAAPTPTEQVETIEGATLNGYQNVIYTEAEPAVIGTTGRPQLLNVYATW